MKNIQLVEESQIINSKSRNPQASQKGDQSLQSQDEHEEIQQINNSHFKNLSSSSIQNVLSEQNSELGQQNQDDEFNFIMQEKNQKTNIDPKQDELQNLAQQHDQKEELIIQNESKINENQSIQNEKQKNIIKVDKNYSNNNNNNLDDKEFKQVSVDITIKKIPTETSDQKYDQQRSNEQESHNKQYHQNFEQSEKLKSIIKSPKSGTSQFQSGDPSLDKSILSEKLQQKKKIQQQQNQMMENNLNEIFQFYVQQFITPIKLHTKDQILEKKQILNQQQFMNFCKDFQLLDLIVSNDFILKYTGQTLQKPLYKMKYKNRVKDSFVITKQILEEVFLKCSGIQQLSFSEFQYSLIKLADIIFPVSNSLKALYSYLGIHDPEIYSKKLVKLEDINQSPLQVQVKNNIKQEANKILPPIITKPKIESKIIQAATQISKLIQKQEQQKSSKVQQNRLQGNSIRWEDLGSSDNDFDPRKLLLEEDICDKEDAMYLKEYMITQQGITKKQDNIKQQQEGQKVKYLQYLDQNQQYKNINKEFNLLVQQNNIEYQRNPISKQKNYEWHESKIINSNQAVNQQQNLLQNQKNQLVHPNSFELRKNYNVIQQVSTVNKSYAYQNMNSSVERRQQNQSLIEHDSKKSILRIEKNQKKREHQILPGLNQNQEYTLRKLQKK